VASRSLRSLPFLNRVSGKNERANV
jgi:hypothetical protein